MKYKSYLSMLLAYSGLAFGATEITHYRAINISGPSLSVGGVSFEASTGAPNLELTGLSFANQAVPLSPTTDSSTSSMVRDSVNGNMKVRVTSVPNGTYDTYLYVWEDNASGTYSVTLNGDIVQANYVSGSGGQWKKLGPWRKIVTSGVIELSTTGAGDANFSGL